MSFSQSVLSVWVFLLFLSFLGNSFLSVLKNLLHVDVSSLDSLHLEDLQFTSWKNGLSQLLKSGVKSVSQYFISQVVSGNSCSVRYQILNQVLSENLYLGRLSVRVKFNLVSSVVGNDHYEYSIYMSVLGFDVSEYVYKTLSLSQLLTNSISGQFEGVKVGSADGSVDLINDELDLLRDILNLGGDISVADFSYSSFKEVRYNFSSGRSFTTGPSYSHVLLNSRRRDQFEPYFLGESVFLISSLLSFSWYSFIFSFCHILIRFIIKFNQNYHSLILNIRL